MFKYAINCTVDGHLETEMNKSIIINTDNDEIISQRFICYYAYLIEDLKHGRRIKLVRLTERFYLYGEGALKIGKIEEDPIGTYQLNTPESAQAELLLAANNAIKL